MTTAVACMAALLIVAGCGGEMAGSDAPSSVQATADASSSEPGAVVFPGCRQAASLDDAGPAPRACSVGSVLVECLDDAGGGCECVTGDSTGCGLDGTNVCGPANGWACKSLCGPDEYAVACGGDWLPSQYTGDEQPPSACRYMPSVSFSLAFFCCPCE